MESKFELEGKDPLVIDCTSDESDIEGAVALINLAQTEHENSRK